MLCPKCKSGIGLYRYEARTQSHMSLGMTCSVCGYWEESLKTVRAARKKKK